MILYAIDPGPEESGIVTMQDARLVSCDTPLNGRLAEQLEVCGKRSGTSLVVEMPQLYRKTPAGSSVLHTAKWVGIFRQAFGLACSSEILRSDVIIHLCGATSYRDEQTGKLRSHSDSSVRASLIDRFGGSKERAIGGLKCQTCKGKGWCGRGRYMCLHCGGTKWEHPPGPLHGVTTHCWSALAVAVTYMDEHK